MLKAADLSASEPLLRVRQYLTVRESTFLDILVDAIGSVPMDQPACARVIGTLARSFLDYSARLGEVKSSFAGLLADARGLALAAGAHRLQIQGTPPIAQLKGRISAHPVWALASSLTEHHAALSCALGAEVAYALVRRKRISESYCNRLRRDIGKVGRLPAPDEAATPEELAQQGFGKTWIKSFDRIDAAVKRVVCKEPPDPDAKEPLDTEQIIRQLTHRFAYPSAALRKGVQHDSSMPPEAMRNVAMALRRSVEAGNDPAFVATAAVLTGLSTHAVLSIPLFKDREQLNGIALSANGHHFLLDLRWAFPSRYRPDPSTAHLFEPAGDIAPLYCPQFFANEVAKRVANAPHATKIADLVHVSGLTARTALLEDDARKLYASLARCSKSLGPVSLHLGIDRLEAAFQTWDFWLINRARIYYSRILGEESWRVADTLYRYLDWPTVAQAADFGAFGSQCVLTPTAVTEIFDYLAARCRKLHPGRRGGLERLLAHHMAYAIYTAALLTFSLGAREAAAYELVASEMVLGQRQVVLNDKGKKDAHRAAPVPINAVAREQLRQWRAHCIALAARLESEGDHRAIALRIRLEQIGRCAPTHLLVAVAGVDVIPLGASQVWGGMPSHLRVPANAGRHFWPNTLHAHRIGSRDVGRFMRHQTLMIDPNDSDCDSISFDAFERITTVQERVLADLCVTAISGLRKT
jgi:hypothetical protein